MGEMLSGRRRDARFSTSSLRPEQTEWGLGADNEQNGKC